MKTEKILMMALKYVVFLFLASMLFLYSCQSSVPNITIYDSIPLKIDLQNNQSTEINNFSGELGTPEIIPLRSKDSSFFIASIRKLVVYKDDYFILDSRFSRLSRFDPSGNFVMSYGNIGLGKNEYSKINDFAIDSVNGQVVIFSNSNTSFFYYSLNTGAFVKKVNTGIYGSQFCLIPGDENLVYRNFSADDKGRDNNIMTLDSLGKETGKCFLFNSKISDVAWESTGFLHSTNGRVLFANAFSDTVYQFSGNGFKPAFEVNITSDIVKSHQINHRKLLAKNTLLDPGASLLGSAFFVNKDFIVFNYQQNRTIKTSIYKPATKQLYTLATHGKEDPLLALFLTPVFLDAENNLYLKFDMKNVLALKKNDPGLFDKLGKDQKVLLDTENQHSGAFLMRVKII